MTAEQQKAYDIGYKAATVGVALTGKVKIDRTAFVTNNYQAFGGDFSLASNVYDYYVKGYNAAPKLGSSILITVLILCFGLGVIFFFRKKK